MGAYWDHTYWGLIGASSANAQKKAFYHFLSLLNKPGSLERLFHDAQILRLQCIRLLILGCAIVGKNQCH